MIEQEKIIALRHRLHQYPELSGKENNTAQTISKFLSDYNPSFLVTEIGGTGVVAVFDYGQEGPAVVIRAELDALPIHEKNTRLPYRSMVAGVSHKCGHDGHMAIVAGLAPMLSEKKYQRGKVILLFQPAEETGKGSLAVLNDPRFKNLDPTHIFALHNLPGFKKNQIIIREGAFNAAVISMCIKLQGMMTHAAEPEKGKNPAMAIAGILSAVDKLNLVDADNEDFALITPIHINMGDKAYGTSAGHGEIHYTARCWSSEKLLSLVGRVKSSVQQISDKHGLAYEFKTFEEFASTNNDPEMVGIITKYAEKNNLDVYSMKMPFRWGEDFGVFTQQWPGAIFGLGAGENHPPLHNEMYDFPDQIIPSGLVLFEAIIDRFLG